MDYHRWLLTHCFGYELLEPSASRTDADEIDLFGRATLGHLPMVRRRLRQHPDAIVVWFVPSAGQLPIIAWAMRGLPNPAAIVVEGAPLVADGDWRRALRRMPGFFLSRLLLNNDNLAKLARFDRLVPIAVASSWQRDRLQRLLPDAPMYQLPNGSPDMPLRRIWRPPASPSVRLLGHDLFYKGIDLALAAVARLAPQHPELSLEWALGLHRQRTPVPRALVGRLRIHRVVDPYRFLAEGSVVLVPLRVSSGTNVYPNALVEAMSSGVPLLTSDLPVHRELLGPLASELTVHEFSVEAWTHRLDELLSDPTKLTTLSERLVDRAREIWGSNLVANRWGEILAAMQVSRSNEVERARRDRS